MQLIIHMIWKIIEPGKEQYSIMMLEERGRGRGGGSDT